MNLNKVFLIGRLTQDVEYRELPSGTPLAVLNIATNRVYKDRTGENKEETQYHRVIAWGKLAELCKIYLTKGRLVFVEGRIQYRNWEGVDGIKRTQTEIIAENIRFGPKSSVEEPDITLEEFEPPSDIFEIPY